MFGAHLLDVSVDGLAAGEDVESEIAAALGPGAVLLCQHGADEPDDAGAVGEDPDHVGAPADLAVEAQLGLLDQIWRQTSLGKAVKARMSARSSSRRSATVGRFSASASTTRSNWACTVSALGWS